MTEILRLHHQIAEVAEGSKEIVLCYYVEKAQAAWLVLRHNKEQEKDRWPILN